MLQTAHEVACVLNIGLIGIYKCGIHSQLHLLYHKSGCFQVGFEQNTAWGVGMLFNLLFCFVFSFNASDVFLEQSTWIVTKTMQFYFTLNTLWQIISTKLGTHVERQSLSWNYFSQTKRNQSKPYYTELQWIIFPLARQQLRFKSVWGVVFNLLVCLTYLSLLLVGFWQKTFYWDQSYSSFHSWVCFLGVFLPIQMSLPLVSQFPLTYTVFCLM